MRKIFTRTISDPEAMQQLAADLCGNFFPKEASFTLFLEGDLGAGKTFLAKSILKIKAITDEITSPTYALVNEYQTAAQRFGHWDFYRLESPNDFFARGFQDLAGEPNSTHLVEWAERLSDDAKAAFNGQKFIIKINFGETPEARCVELIQAA